MTNDPKFRNSLKIGIPDAITPSLQQQPVCAIDLGFSNGRRSCGFATSSDDGVGDQPKLHFGELVVQLRNWIETCPVSEAVVILEAPLSQHFEKKISRGQQFWNKSMRKFERGSSYSCLPTIGSKRSPWYSGPGAGVSLAALTLLRSLSDLDIAKTVHLFEGFHPQWLAVANEEYDTEDWNDYQVARRLIDGFRAETPRVIQVTADPPGFSHAGNAASAVGLNVPDHSRNRAPMAIFASETLFMSYDH